MKLFAFLFAAECNQLTFLCNFETRRSADTKKMAVAAYYVDMEAAIKL